jgi:hypothetical protein
MVCVYLCVSSVSFVRVGHASDIDIYVLAAFLIRLQILCARRGLRYVDCFVRLNKIVSVDSLLSSHAARVWTHKGSTPDRRERVIVRATNIDEPAYKTALKLQ